MASGCPGTKRRLPDIRYEALTAIPTLASSSANGSAERPPDDRLRRTIQYSVKFAFNIGGAAYWMPAFAGMTGLSQ
jgi:hypothetical protein